MVVLGGLCWLFTELNILFYFILLFILFNLLNAKINF